MLSIHSTPSDSPKDVGAVSVSICVRHYQCEDLKKALVRYMKNMSSAWYPEDIYFEIMNLEWFPCLLFWIFNLNSNSAFKHFSITPTIRNVCLFLLTNLDFSCNHRLQ